jgi:hypothetical protein
MTAGNLVSESMRPKERAMPRKILMTLAMLTFALSANALEIGGVNLPDAMPAGSETLKLNGAGLRTKFFVKVYAAGLYLQERASDGQAIAAADKPMALRMRFIHDGVAPEKLVEAWNDGFKAATGGNTALIDAEISRFNRLFTAEARKGDVYDLLYLPGKGVEVSMNGTLRDTIPGLSFKQALFGIWLGKEPADATLKKGLLGS